MFTMINIKHLGKIQANQSINKYAIFAKLTCIFISHGGGAPSGMPRASFNSCDNVPGFISLSFTYRT